MKQPPSALGRLFFISDYTPGTVIQLDTGSAFIVIWYYNI